MIQSDSIKIVYHKIQFTKITNMIPKGIMIISLYWQNGVTLRNISIFLLSDLPFRSLSWEERACPDLPGGLGVSW